MNTIIKSKTVRGVGVVGAIEKSDKVCPNRVPVPSYPMDGEVFIIRESGTYRVSEIFGDRMTLSGVEGHFDPRYFHTVS